MGHGLSCLYPGDQFCVASLSAGGEDAVSMREFDLKQSKFVGDGFTLPHSKQSVAWVDKDTLLVERDWGAGTMTSSGYPFVVKEWKRGTPLESAKELFRGAATDQVGSRGHVLQDAQGDRLEVFSRGVTFFRDRDFGAHAARAWSGWRFPAKARLDGLISGRVLLTIDTDWTPMAGGRTFVQGSLLEMKLSDVMKDPAHLKPAVVFEPTAQEFLEEADTTRDRLVMTTLAHVQGRAYVYTPGAKGWTRERLPVPENSCGQHRDGERPGQPLLSWRSPAF